ncbi:MAG: hypothetical protein K9M98_05520 [Cephaloticoccus sp.]|nr:hypothetical protein [Cephaloticoccus sp.]MCF7759943.1 hypothetical protein [Cephaloticoccus sp.]
MRSIRSNQGSVILLTIVFTTVIGIVAGSLLTYTMSERRLNQRSSLRFEAKDAAEALLEYAAAELSVRFQSSLNFSTTELTSNPITTHNSRFGTLYNHGTGVVWTNIDLGSPSLWVSQSGEAGRRYVDPNNPENDYDPLRGQLVSVQAVRMLARVTATNNIGVSATTYATQLIEVRESSLFNYAMFYNLPMEFHPSPSMTIVGPVQANKGANLTEGNTLTFLGTFSTAGTFTAGATTSGRPTGQRINFTTGVDADGNGVNDTVSIINPTVDGAALSTYVDSALHSRDSAHDFSTVASQLWRGYVQDASMGVQEQQPPGILTGSQAHDLIEAPNAAGTATIEEQKFSNKAGLYFVVEPNGNTVGFNSPTDATTYKSTASASRAAWRTANPSKIVTAPANMIKTNRRMYDFREGRWVNTIDVDMGNMRTAVNTTTSGAATNFKVNGSDWSLDSSGGWNGVVYFDVESPNTGYSSTSDVGSMGTASGTRTAVRFVNASQIPNRQIVTSSQTEGITLATNTAAYIVGNFNADGTLASDLSDMTTPETGEAPAAIVADAINVLSNSWWNSGTGKPDGDSTSNNTTRPGASNTEISCAFMAGIVSTSGTSSSSYSGGVENYPRFHENWGGDSLRYRGSIVALFESEIATGPWGNAKYGAPNREWGFNSLYAGGRYAPGTPRLRTYRRIDYRDLTPVEFNAMLADTRFTFRSM